MQTDKNITSFLIQPILVLLLSSCVVTRKPPEVAALPDSGQIYKSDPVAKRFEESGRQVRVTAESTIELSEKYAKLSEETAALRLRNQELITENRRLEEQLVALETQLKKAEKELTEANSLLMEMLVELNDWKASVIGFREEMRGAERAQLEALLKILKVLGGEIKDESVQGEGTGLDRAPSIEPAKPQFQETPTAGERNE